MNDESKVEFVFGKNEDGFEGGFSTERDIEAMLRHTPYIR